jgi:hypothetical protein
VRYETTQPWLEMSQVEAAFVEQVHQLGVDLQGRPDDAIAVDAQEDIRRGKGHPFVAVDEGMIDGKAFKEGGGLGYDVFVIAGLGRNKAASRAPRSRTPEAPP